MHQYPLHRISYCADDKGEKRFFSFIAKEADSERHMCFVFVSDKLVSIWGNQFDLTTEVVTKGTFHSGRCNMQKENMVERTFSFMMGN